MDIKNALNHIFIRLAFNSKPHEKKTNQKKTRATKLNNINHKKNAQ